MQEVIFSSRACISRFAWFSVKKNMKNESQLLLLICNFGSVLVLGVGVVNTEYKTAGVRACVLLVGPVS